MNTTNESLASINANVGSELNCNRSSVRSVVSGASALWFGIVFLLGVHGGFVGSAGSPPLPIFFGFAIPLAVFFAAYFGSGAFRAFVLGADLRFVAAMQGG